MDEHSVELDDSGSVGLVEIQYFTFASPDEPFVLENQQTLPSVTTAFEVYGSLNKTRDNVILVGHGLTGSSHAAGRYSWENRRAGYWDALIGPGRVFDTDRFCIVAPNALGGCRGSTGPASIDPLTGKQYGLKFPIVTVRDMVRVQKRLIDHLGIRRLHLVTGGSMGGMQALEWAVTYPDMVHAICPIAASARTSAQAIAFNECMRRAIMLDSHWRKGEYYGGALPEEGLALARMIGTITYLSDPIMQQMFGRKPDSEETSLEHSLHARFDVERYLHDEGEKLVKRFDPNSYLYVTRAIDLHDISRGYCSLEEAYRRIRANVLLIGIRSDILFYPGYIREMDTQLRRAGARSAYWEIDSDYGHDAFLVEQEKMIPPLTNLLATLPEGA
jgi:homoserine O-acetyltransferase